MKRYLCFLGEPYYPNGGMSDFINDADSLEEAMHIINIETNNAHLDERACWSHIWDSEKREIIFEQSDSEPQYLKDHRTVIKTNHKLYIGIIDIVKSVQDTSTKGYEVKIKH